MAKNVRTEFRRELNDSLHDIHELRKWLPYKGIPRPVYASASTGFAPMLMPGKSRNDTGAGDAGFTYPERVIAVTDGAGNPAAVVRPPRAKGMPRPKLSERTSLMRAAKQSAHRALGYVRSPVRTRGQRTINFPARKHEPK